eukprot:Nk52_evm1s535 gene=Nk52_evmTU1s535
MQLTQVLRMCSAAVEGSISGAGTATNMPRMQGVKRYVADLLKANARVSPDVKTVTVHLNRRGAKSTSARYFVRNALPLIKFQNSQVFVNVNSQLAVNEKERPRVEVVLEQGQQETIPTSDKNMLQILRAVQALGKEPVLFPGEDLDQMAWENSRNGRKAMKNKNKEIKKKEEE